MIPYIISKRSPLRHNLSKTNQAHIFTRYFFKIHFTIIFPSKLRCTT